MRKLLNTLYVTNENIYMTLDGENVVCKENNEVKLRLPFSNIEAIFCFSYLGCSPALMGKCADYGIPINFISPSGRFLARVQGAFHTMSQLAVLINLRIIFKRSFHNTFCIRQFCGNGILS